MIILLLKSSQPGLFDKVVQIKGSVAKDGTVRAAHTAIRHVAAPEAPKQADLFSEPAKAAAKPAPKPEPVAVEKPPEPAHTAAPVPKAVPAKAEGVKVYRATSGGFDQGKAGDDRQYWADNRAAAADYADARHDGVINEGHVAFRKPYLLEDDEAARDLAEKIGEKWDYGPYWDLADHPDTPKVLAALGYDGLIFDDSTGATDHKTYMTFPGSTKVDVAGPADAASEKRAADAKTDRGIAERLRAGGEATDADLKHLDLKRGSAGLEYLSPVVQRLFGVSEANARAAMGSTLRETHKGAGAGTWSANPKDALRAAALYARGVKEGDRKVEDGVTYELRGGRWHKVDLEFEAVEDRADLAEAMAADPHSEDSKAKISAMVERAAPPADPQPIGDDLDPNSPNYRYRDTGYVGGSRKEMAALQIRGASRRGQRVRVTDVDWDDLETNPREAKDLITKSHLFGDVDWAALAEGGMDPGAGFLVAKVYAAVGATPVQDTADGRRDYSLAMTTLRDRMETAKTVDDVARRMEEIADERDGAALNDQEAELYQAAKALYVEAVGARREVERKYEEISGRITPLNSQIYALEHEIRNRERRGWKPEPGKAEEVAGLRAEMARISAAATQYRADNNMNAVVHRTQDSMGISSRFEYPHKADEEKAALAMRQIKALAIMRNKAENPLTRAWNSLGSGFNAVIDFKRHKGSDAFARHFATARAGRVTDWSWNEKGRAGPRGATKESTSFQLLVAEEFSRKGGPAVTVDSTAALKEVFNLREVQSGNWVLDDPNSAKFHVEACATAFADLADILGVPAENVSFNGRLAMAFGARGKGGALAHYEPVQRVINITKMAGAGSLAHEWFHCVDNLVKESVTGMPSSQDDFATEQPGDLDHGELQTAFRALTEAMMSGPHRKIETLAYSEAEERWAGQVMAANYSGATRNQIKEAPSLQVAVDRVEAMYQRGAFGPVDKKKSKTNRDNWRKIALITHGANPERSIRFETGTGMSLFLMDSVDLDKGVSGKYWSQPKEMAARAFSTYIEDKLAGAGRENTYLVAACNNQAYAHTPFRPFADGEEGQRIHAAMDRLFDAIRGENVLAKAAALVS